MSIHRSLVPLSKLTRHRNVLSRAERIKLLSADGKWKDEDSIFGLPKVKHILHKVKAKPKKEEAAAAIPGAPETAGATPAAGAKPGAAPAAKTATPAPTAGDKKKPEAKK
jgi:small basic protein (TIGR04137 family)